MRTALRRRGGAPADAPTAEARERPAALALAAGIAVLLAGALFAGGGSDSTDLLWVGGGAVILIALAAAAVLVGGLPRPELGPSAAAFAALLGGLAVWMGVSILWSLEPSRSWGYLNRGLVYVAFALLGLMLGALLRDAPRRVALGLGVLLGAVLAWSLLGKVFPDLGPELTRNARLRAPVGYWNALALLGVFALSLSLYAVSERGRPVVRAAGAVLAYLAIVAIALTFSRGAVIIAALAVALWLALSRRVLETLSGLAFAGIAALTLSAWAFTRPGLVDEGELERASDGRLFGILLVLGGAVVFRRVLGLARGRWPERLPAERRRELGVAALAAIGAVLVIAFVVVSVRAGGPGEWIDARVSEFANPASASLTERSERLTTASSNHRWRWWGGAWDSFADDPLEGTGAGSFGLAHRLYRTEYAPAAREPHSFPLQLLGELGLVGAALGLGALVALLLAARASLARLQGTDRSAALALAVCGVAFGLHLLIDIGWDFVAVSAPAFVMLGVLASAGRRARSRGRRLVLPAIAVAGAAGGVLFSLASPWLAERRADESIEAVSRGDFAAAAAAAEDAHGLNPLSPEPLFRWAVAEEVRGDEAEARRLYVKAVDLQPLDPETWFQLGVFELDAAGDCRAAYTYLNRSYTLDRFGPAGEPGGPLDVARAAVNAGRERC